jgi:hypothetical protein
VLILVALHFALLFRTILRTSYRRVPERPESALPITRTICHAIFCADFSRTAFYFSSPYHAPQISSAVPNADW